MKGLVPFIKKMGNGRCDRSLFLCNCDLCIHFANENEVVGVEAAPAPIADLPLDQQIIHTVHGADLIFAGGIVILPQQVR